MDWDTGSLPAVVSSQDHLTLSHPQQELKSYYEAKNDPACPFTGWRVVPNKGKVMEPWC